jgi:PAS domain S-box-containing protein
MNEIPVNLPVPPCDAAFDILEELPVAYIELNAEGLVMRANRAARAIYPHEQGKFIGEILWNLMPAAEKEPSRAAYFKTIESGETPKPIRRTVYTSAGAYRTFELHRSLICDAGGKPAGVRMVTFDVTEAQLANEETHQARLWLESVMASIPDAVIVTDALGFVCNVNPAAEELLGWKAEEMIGMEVEKGLPQLSYTSADQRSLTHRIALEGRTKGIATVLDHARRELRVEISTSPIVNKESGFTEGVVSVLRRVEEAGQAGK